MSLAQRLLLGSLGLLLAFIVIVVVLSGERMSGPLERLVLERLEREARLIALEWSPADDPDAFADTAGAVLGMRVTLIAHDGRVVGDSEEPRNQLEALENHAGRPEIRAALDSGIGLGRRTSASVGRDQLYVAVRAPQGVARVSIDPARVDAIVRRARRSVLTAGSVAILIAAGVAVLFAQTVTRPIGELRDVAQALAAGDLTRRPTLAGSGEVGDLALAIHRMAEQLETRLEALEREELLLASTIASLSEGVMIVGADGRVVRTNDAARRMLGLADPVPFPLDRLPRERTVRDAIADALAGGAVDELEVHHGALTLVMSTKPLGAYGAVLTLRDVTRARRLEATRRDFVANVSHELKTPLTIISGYAETLQDDELAPEQRRQFAETIRASAHRMQRLVDDLLDLSRIESGGWKPNPTPIHIGALIEDVLRPLQPVAERKGTRLESDVAPDAEVIVADATALRQVLTNLTDNAIRHTNAGSVTVFTRRDVVGVAVGVRDTGSGIAAEHLPRIFERFYRVDTARSREAGGTGLGLSIVKHLAEAHGGTVRAESAPGRGTTIIVVFPDSLSAA